MVLGRLMRQQHLDQQRLPCSVFVNLFFIAARNKLLNRLLWVLTSLTPISCILVKCNVDFDLPYLSTSLLHMLSRLLQRMTFIFWERLSLLFMWSPHSLRFTVMSFTQAELITLFWRLNQCRRIFLWVRICHTRPLWFVCVFLSRAGLNSPALFTLVNALFHKVPGGVESALNEWAQTCCQFIKKITLLSITG